MADIDLESLDQIQDVLEQIKRGGQNLTPFRREQLEGAAHLFNQIQGYLQRIRDHNEKLTAELKKQLDFIYKKSISMSETIDSLLGEERIRKNISNSLKKELDLVNQKFRTTFKDVSILKDELGIKYKLLGLTKQDVVFDKKRVSFYRDRAKYITDIAKTELAQIKRRLQYDKLSQKEFARLQTERALVEELASKAELYQKALTGETNLSPRQIKKLGKDVHFLMNQTGKVVEANGPLVKTKFEYIFKNSIRSMPQVIAKSMKAVTGTLIKELFGTVMKAGLATAVVKGMLQVAGEKKEARRVGFEIGRQFLGGGIAAVRAGSTYIGEGIRKAAITLQDKMWIPYQQSIKNALTLIQTGVIDSTRNIGKRLKDMTLYSMEFGMSLKETANIAARFKVLGESTNKFAGYMRALQKVARDTHIPFQLLRQSFNGLMGDSIAYGTNLKTLIKLQGDLAKTMMSRGMKYGISTYEQITRVTQELTSLQEKGSLGFRTFLGKLMTGKSGLGALFGWEFGKGATVTATKGGYEITGGGNASLERLLTLSSFAKRFMAERGGTAEAFEQLKMFFSQQGMSLSPESLRVLLGPQEKLTNATNKQIDKMILETKPPSERTASLLSELVPLSQKAQIIQEKFFRFMGEIATTLVDAVVGGFKATVGALLHWSKAKTYFKDFTASMKFHYGSVKEAGTAFSTSMYKVAKEEVSNLVYFSEIGSGKVQEAWEKSKKKRASGGLVTAGNIYRVNEAGMEFFIPSTSGTVLPNGTPINVSVPVQILGSPENVEEIAREVSEKVYIELTHQLISRR